MPIRYDIDRDQRLVIATVQGVLTEAEIFNYQREVWSQPENSGYGELIDMTAVSEIESATPSGMSRLADLSSSMDAPDSPSKLAIVATSNLHFGLGRRYQARREMARKSTKVVSVFRGRQEALEWLGVSIKPT
jgi:hypothetical protein